MFVPAGERNINVVYGVVWLSTDKDRETTTFMPVAYAFVNNSGANDGDDTSRFLRHRTKRDSFLLSREDYCVRQNEDLGDAFLRD